MPTVPHLVTPTVHWSWVSYLFCREEFSAYVFLPLRKLKIGTLSLVCGD